MKQFSTITGAFNYIKKSTNTGHERIINDAIHFGVGSGVYVYSTDAKLYNLPDLPISDRAFTHLRTNEHIEKALSYYLQIDEHLTVI